MQDELSRDSESLTLPAASNNLMIMNLAFMCRPRKYEGDTSPKRNCVNKQAGRRDLVGAGEPIKTGKVCPKGTALVGLSDAVSTDRRTLPTGTDQPSLRLCVVLRGGEVNPTLCRSYTVLKLDRSRSRFRRGCTSSRLTVPVRRDGGDLLELAKIPAAAAQPRGLPRWLIEGKV